MKIRSARLSSIMVALAFVSSTGGGIAQSAGEQPAPQLRMYTVGEINASRYDVVSRLWADSWRSAVWLETFPTQGEAVAALQTEAARRGADALLNVYCFDQGRRWAWSTTTEPSFLCYGLAIRVRPGQG